MKRQLLISTATALLLSATVANAEGWYAAILGGPSFDPHLSVNTLPVGVDNGFNVGGRVGTTLGGLVPLSGFSVEADTFYTQSPYAGGQGRIASSSFMGDLVYHIDTGLPFGIYGGAGLGPVHTDFNNNAGASGSGTVFGWQMLGGLEYKLSPLTSLFTEYRYQNAHDANLGGLTGIGNTSNNWSFGLKFNM